MFGVCLPNQSASSRKASPCFAPQVTDSPGPVTQGIVQHVSWLESQEETLASAVEGGQ